MGFKNFLIGFIKNLIVLVVATLVFSSITFDFPDLIKGVFGDIFLYASPDAQTKVVSKLAESCSVLEQGKQLVTINQICANKSFLSLMKENCANYRELERRNIRVDNEAQVKETCQQIESGEIKRACEEIESKKSLLPDLSDIGALCKDYKAGKINDKEFFYNVISGAIPSQMQMPNIWVLKKYNETIDYLNKNKIFYFAVMLILMVVLYLLVFDVKLFIFTLTQILFSIGILIMLPYFAILAYDKFIGIDTTPLLSSVFGEGNVFDLKAITSVILLLFLRTYNSLIILMGILFLGIGVAGKGYSWKLKKQGKKAETKTEKRPEKGAKKNKEAEKETDQEADKKDRERKRTTKEILDELEEMQKKKMKEEENN